MGHTCYIKLEDTSEHSILSSKFSCSINRSQAQSRKPHEVWVTTLRADGTVVTGRCTYMAGFQFRRGVFICGGPDVSSGNLHKTGVLYYSMPFYLNQKSLPWLP